MEKLWNNWRNLLKEFLLRGRRKSSNIILCWFLGLLKVGGHGMIMINWKKLKNSPLTYNVRVFFNCWRNNKLHGLLENQFLKKLYLTTKQLWRIQSIWKQFRWNWQETNIRLVSSSVRMFWGCLAIVERITNQIQFIVNVPMTCKST